MAENVQHRERIRDVARELKGAAEIIHRQTICMSRPERESLTLGYSGGHGLLGGGLGLPEIPKPRWPPTIAGNAIAIDNLQLIDKAEALGGSIGESVRQFIVGASQGIVSVLADFADRLKTFGEGIGREPFEASLGRLFNTVSLVFRDGLSAIGTVLCNLGNNLLSGVLAGTLLGRRLTSSEMRFAHTIFGNKITLHHVRVAVTPITPSGRGMVAANVIHVNSLDLRDNNVRSLFAHELTHIYQDQKHFHGRGTHHATAELLDHWLGQGQNPYEVNLTPTSRWNTLGVEAQATVVENYQTYLDGGDILGGGLPEYRRVLEQARLFEWR